MPPEPDRCRFCRLLALCVLALATLFGALTTLQLLLTAGPNLHKYAAQFLFHDGIRATAPAAGGSALVLALVLWAQPLSVQNVELQLKATLQRALMVALPAYLASVLVVSLIGFALLFRELDQGFGAVSWRDFWAGGRFAICDALLITFLARRYLARLQASGRSLPEKLIVVVTVTVGLRATLATILDLLFG